MNRREGEKLQKDIESMEAECLVLRAERGRIAEILRTEKGLVGELEDISGRTHKRTLEKLVDSCN